MTIDHRTIVSTAGMAAKRARAELAKRELVRRRARRSLIEFIKFTKPDYRVNWHHKVMCREYERWVHGDTKRLMIVAPPRTGKSEIVSRRGPAWCFGNYADDTMIAASYAASLASRMSRDVMSIMDDPSYGKVFPDVSLHKPGHRQAGTVVLRTQREWRIVKRRGHYIAAGVDGGITGSGFMRGIIDDPIKGWKEAQSKTIREACWQWFWNDFMTRQDMAEASVLLTMTRWHEDDLMGRLLDDINAGVEKPWRIVHFEAIKSSSSGRYAKYHHPEDPRQEGDVLWEEKRGYFDPFRRFKRIWSTGFQGHPTPEAGGIVKRTWFRRYRCNDLPSWSDFDATCITVDCAFTESATSSFVVFEAWGKHGANAYLLDQHRARMDFTKTLDALAGHRAKTGRRAGGFIGVWPFIASRVIEDKANGPAVINTLKREIPGIVKFNPGKHGSKEQRLRACSPWFEAGNVWIPHDDEVINGVPVKQWIEDYIDELTNFPGTKHDDQVDCTTMALLRLLGGFKLLIGRASETEQEKQQRTKPVTNGHNGKKRRSSPLIGGLNGKFRR